MRANHKRTWLLLFSLLCATAANADIQGRIVGYGTYTVTNNFGIINTPGSTSGVSRAYTDPPTFTAVTDRIRAKIGVRFGIVFELTNLPKIRNATVGIVLVTKDPSSRRPNGKTSTRHEDSFRIAVRGRDRIVSWTGVGLMDEEDLIPGIWTFEVRSYSRLLCKKDFTVVRN